MIGGATILILQACLLATPAKCEQLTIEVSDPKYELFENKKLCYQYGRYEAQLFNRRNKGVKAIKRWKCIKKPIRTYET